ncbi:MAG TPA: Gfo/Idh/MocA family oxidoreductase, partial [Vicinamibacterales bacterium]
SRLTGLVSGSVDKAKALAAQYGVPDKGLYSYDTYDRIADNPDIHAVYIVLPNNMHAEYTIRAHKAGKHVLVEKPMASSSDLAAKLIDEAAARRLVLMVDHTFVYTGAVRKMRELTETGELGEIYYYDSVRINLGLFQHDVSVLWDLAVHDLAIMDYVLPQRPVAVSATGLAHVKGQPHNIAYMSMFFEDNLIAHVHVNWLSPVKVRRTLLGGSRRMVMFDDLEASEKLKVYDRGISLNPSPEHVYQMLVGYRAGDMWAPQLAVSEALSVEAAHFVDCVANSRKPLTDGQAGWRVVRLLEAATESMMRQGQPVSLDTVRV